MSSHYSYPIQNMELIPPLSAPPQLSSQSPITPPQKKRRGRPAKRLPFCTEMFYSTPVVPTHSSVPISPEDSFSSFHSQPSMNVQAQSTPLLTPPEPSPNRVNSYPSLHQQNLSISSISSLTSVASSAGPVELPVSAFDLGPGLSMTAAATAAAAGPAIASNSPYSYYGHQLMVERSNHSDYQQQNIFLQPENSIQEYNLQYNDLKDTNESLLPLSQGFTQNPLRSLQPSVSFDNTAPLMHPIPVFAAPPQQLPDDYYSDITISGTVSGLVSGTVSGNASGAVSPISMPPCIFSSQQSSVVTSPIIPEPSITNTNAIQRKTILERRRSSPHRSSTNLRRLQLSRKSSLSTGSGRLQSGLVSAPASANPYTKRRISLSIQHGQAVVAHEGKQDEDDLVPPPMTRHVSYDVRDLARGVHSAFSSFGIQQNSSSPSTATPSSTFTTPEEYIGEDDIILFPQYSPKAQTPPATSLAEEDVELDESSQIGQKDDARDALRRTLARSATNIASNSSNTSLDNSDSDNVNQNQNHQYFYAISA